jgi:SWI/SNF-related matrix-associated actin-dependent regulator 1 of chromatin subfamily A
LGQTAKGEKVSSIPVPFGLAYFPFQLEGIKFALAHPGTLLADECGVGKTIQAIGVINTLPELERILILCPATMRGIWKAELEKWLVQPAKIVVVGIDKNPCLTEASPQQILICNYDRLPQVLPLLRDRVWDLAIYDECHYLKNRESRRSRIALSIQAERRMALSGTPLQNRPIELFTVLSWLDPGEWPPKSYFEFGQRYCGARYNGFSWDLSGASNLSELNQRLASGVMIRRTKAQVLPELPPKLRSVVELEVDSNIKQVVKAELWAFERWMEEASKTENHTGNGNGRYTAAVKGLRRFQGAAHDNLAVARHRTALAKVPLVAAFVTELLHGGTGKIVIFGYHRAVITGLAEVLSEFHPVILIGDTPAKDRDQVIHLFQTAPEVRVFIGNIVAAGVGITLAPASSHCVFAELSYVPAELNQCEDRLHRVGARDSVLVQHLVLSGSLDALMVNLLLKKQKILDEVLVENERAADTRVCP